MASFLNSISNRTGNIVSDQLGGLADGLLGNDFSSADIPLYEEFLYNILADANNAVTESSYWVVFFSKGNATGELNVKQSMGSVIKEGLANFASTEFGVSKNNFTPSNAKSRLEVTPWTTGGKTLAQTDQFFNNLQNAMMLVQGIEVPGDSFNIERQGFDNIGGFLKPAITKPRNDMPEMEITFLENNSSVTDLVLRPWVIHSSYASLKFANRAKITCYNLTRSPTGFRVRKEFTFHNAVPISVDAEQYDYTGATSYGKRQTKFVFTHYDIKEGTELQDGFLKGLANFALQKTRNFVSNVVESGVDVVAGGANQIFTNIKGSFVDAVDDHLQDVQSRIREYAKDAEDSIIDNGQRIIDKTIGFTPDKDSIMRGGEDFPTSGTPDNPSPRLPVDASKDDSLSSPPVPPRSTGVTNNAKYTLVKISNDDTPDTGALNLQSVTINNNEGGLDTTNVTTPNDDVIRR